MSAMSHFSSAYGTLAEPTVAPARKSVLKRFFDRLIEARMRKADEFMRQHRHLVPHELEAQAAWQITERSENSLPFIR